MNIIDQLIKTGFKKNTLTLPDIGGNSNDTMVSYRKGTNSISYKEKKVDGSDMPIYIFSINSEDYK